MTDLATCHYNLAREYVRQSNRHPLGSVISDHYLTVANRYFALAARKES